MFLRAGVWNGARIVSQDWVRVATAAETSADPAEDYQYFWWIDTERPGRFYALGNFGQYVSWHCCTGRRAVDEGRLPR